MTRSPALKASTVTVSPSCAGASSPARTRNSTSALIGGASALRRCPRRALVRCFSLVAPKASWTRLVAVAFGGAHGRDRARAGLEHGHAGDAAVLAEDLGHSELSGEDRGHRVGRLAATGSGGQTDLDVHTRRAGDPGAAASRPSSGVGWWMSIRRLWVRISKCSRESLSLNGRADHAVDVLLGRQGHRARRRSRPCGWPSRRSPWRRTRSPRCRTPSGGCGSCSGLLRPLVFWCCSCVGLKAWLLGFARAGPGRLGPSAARAAGMAAGAASVPLGALGGVAAAPLRRALRSVVSDSQYARGARISGPRARGATR